MSHILDIKQANSGQRSPACANLSSARRQSWFGQWHKSGTFSGFSSQPRALFQRRVLPGRAPIKL